jgi:hypothetical protein
MCLGIGRPSKKRRGRAIDNPSDVELHEVPAMSNPNYVTPAGRRRRRSRNHRREDRRTRPRQGPSSGSRQEPSHSAEQSETPGEDNITHILGSAEQARGSDVLPQPHVPGSGHPPSHSIRPQSMHPGQRMPTHTIGQTNDNPWRPHGVAPDPSLEQSGYHHDSWYRPPTHVTLPREQVRQPYQHPHALIGGDMPLNNRMNQTPGPVDCQNDGGAEGWPHLRNPEYQSLSPSDMVSQNSCI